MRTSKTQGDPARTGTVTNASLSGTFSLGGSLVVNRLGFGAMRITGDGVWGEPRDPGEARRVLRRAVELGVNLIDTADSYGPEVSERLIAEALYPYPEDLVIATKGGFRRPGPGRWVEDGRPEHLRGAVEGSLRRLRVERIDLYQLHRIDPKVPAADQFGVLAELRNQGKIRHLGLSEVTVAQIETARAVLPIVSVQNRYNLADREWENVLDYCGNAGLGFIPWFPLAVGKMAEADGPIAQIAQRHSATPAQIALAWMLQRSPVMLPIPGTSTVAHLEENIAAAAIRLDPGEFDIIGRT
jgi:aryl-alcohol dehydrogenase-like predicted oxidoreductase